MSFKNNISFSSNYEESERFVKLRVFQPPPNLKLGGDLRINETDNSIYILYIYNTQLAAYNLHKSTINIKARIPVLCSRLYNLLLGTLFFQTTVKNSIDRPECCMIDLSYYDFSQTVNNETRKSLVM